MHHTKQRFPRSQGRHTETRSTSLNPSRWHRGGRLLAVTAAFAFSVGIAASAAGQEPAAGEASERSSGSWYMPGSAPPPQPAPPAAPPPNAYPPNAAPGQPYGYAPQPSPYGPPPPGYPPPATAPAPDEVDDEEPSPPFFDLAVSTNVPLSIGGQASIELPARLLAQLELGWMPRGYGSAINGLVQSFGAYNREVSALVDGALADAFVLRVSAGWRPFESAGFEIFGGYTSVSLSGSVSAADVAKVVGGDFASDVAGQLLTEDVTLSSQLHNFHVALGWRWVAFDHLVIRANLGYLQTLASSSSVESSERPEIAEKANAVVDPTLDDIYTSYVKMPTLALGAGYRF